MQQTHIHTFQEVLLIIPKSAVDLNEAKLSLARRKRATNIALSATFLLFVMKVVISIFTESVGLLSEAIHTGLDLLSSVVTYFVIRVASQPADSDHPFGHGKIESLSALFEAFLLLVAAGYIVFEGISKWALGTHHLHNISWGLGVIGFSMIINLLVYLQNRHVAKAEESIAIETNAFHFLTDVFSSLAVFISLGLVHFTGATFWDPLVALIIAVYMSWIGILQIKKCLSELSDTALPSDEVDLIRNSIEKHKNEYLDFHDLRTRKVGAVRHVDLHLELCSEQRVADAHEVCDRIEEDMQQKFKEVQVNIHVEPCGHHSATCKTICEHYNKPRQQVVEDMLNEANKKR
ncbi:MAG: cation diffusion facilitator family transporter [Bacteriovoracia bacterium]